MDWIHTFEKKNAHTR